MILSAYKLSRLFACSCIQGVVKADTCFGNAPFRFEYTLLLERDQAEGYRSFIEPKKCYIFNVEVGVDKYFYDIMRMF